MVKVWHLRGHSPSIERKSIGYFIICKSLQRKLILNGMKIKVINGDAQGVIYKGLGIKGVLEDKLYSLWEASLRKLKPSMEAIGIAEWLMVIIKHDKTGNALPINNY
jgi:hypothetical protein